MLRQLGNLTSQTVRYHKSITSCIAVECLHAFAFHMHSIHWNKKSPLHCTQWCKVHAKAWAELISGESAFLSRNMLTHKRCRLSYTTSTTLFLERQSMGIPAFTGTKRLSHAMGIPLLTISRKTPMLCICILQK